jgi:hypothetical protein
MEKMTKNDDGGAAFPGPFSGHCGTESHADPCGCYVDSGMTLRDYFAGQVLPAIMKGALELAALGEKHDHRDLAIAAYRVADAMILARSENIEKERRNQALALVQELFSDRYQIRWTCSQGDFSGREVTFDVFNIPVTEHRPFLREVEPLREKLTELTGSRCTFIFHTPEATKEHYQL